MIKPLILSFLVLTMSSTAIGQIERMQKAREKMERVTQGAQEREKARRNAEIDGSGPARPKAAVMNVDVQMLLSKTDHNSFADARPAAVTKIVDGEPLWLYLKFKGKLGDYVITKPVASEPNTFQYLLYAEIGPQGELSPHNQYVLQFTKEDLALPELKINLAPGLLGRNKSIPVFLMNSGNAKPGVWRNEFRITNTTAVPRAPTDNLAKSDVTFDFSKGLAKYPVMESDYDSIVLRGTTDTSKLPAPGSFFSDTLKQSIAQKLFAERITPVKFYFAGDNWSQYSVLSKTERKVYAVYSYKSGEECHYGVARVVEKYDQMNNSFGETQITLQNELPLACTELN